MMNTDETIEKILDSDLNEHIQAVHDSDDKNYSTEITAIEKIQKQDLDKHIHESDAKSNNDKQEVADEAIEKILTNLENNEIQMQDLKNHIHHTAYE